MEGVNSYNFNELNKIKYTRLEEQIANLGKVYQTTIETRNFEIMQLLQRNNFFMLFQGVVLSGVLTTSASKPHIEAAITLFCFFLSCYQTAVASGAKYWQEYWECKTSDIEEILDTLYKQYFDIRKVIDIKAQETLLDNYMALDPNTFSHQINNIKKQIDDLNNQQHFFYPLFQFKNQDQNFLAKVKGQIEKKDSGMFDLIINEIILNKYSVSRIPIIIGLFFSFLWFCLFMQTWNFEWTTTQHLFKGFQYEPNTQSIVDILGIKSN